MDSNGLADPYIKLIEFQKHLKICATKHKQHKQQRTEQTEGNIQPNW